MLSLVQESEEFIVFLFFNALSQKYIIFLCKFFQNGDVNLKYKAAAAKSLQSCLTLCDPMKSSPPGSSVHRILRARILEWVAISFSQTIMGTPSKEEEILQEEETRPHLSSATASPKVSEVSSRPTLSWSPKVLTLGRGQSRPVGSSSF